MTNIPFNLPLTIVAQGKSAGFLCHSDLEAQIPAWNLEPEMRDSILASLSAEGIMVFSDGIPEAATMGRLEYVDESTPESITFDQLGTGEGFDLTVKCRFSFVCDKNWLELEAVPGTSISNCSKCERSVEICFTVAEASAAIARKQCVALVFQHTLIDSK